MTTKEQQLNEVFSQASYMGIDEMRHLYYGRNNLYVKFTQDDGISKKGDSEVDTPYGLSVFEVRDVVGRKVNTKLLYAGVMQYRPDGPSFLDDIALYNYSDYQNDIAAIRTLEYIDSERLDDAVETVEKGTYGTYFEQIWKITRMLAANKAQKGFVWRAILMDIGYTGFRDNRGKGLFTRRGDPVTFILDFVNAELIDIMPIQKYKSDPRSVVRRRIQMRNKYMWAKRNKIAKYPTEKFRISGKPTPDALLRRRMGIVV